jgi:hypothetical protein
MATDTGVIKWHVVPQGQRLTTVLTNAGTGFTDVWEVTYMIDSGPAKGTTGQVRVPAAQYNAETVKATIDAQVQHMHNVASL